MRIARRNGRPLMLAAGGVALAASLFFTAQSINVPVYSNAGAAAASAEPVVFPVTPVRDRIPPAGGLGSSLALQMPKPDANEPAIPDLVQEPLPAMQYPVGTDSAPRMAGGSMNPGGIEFPWALGVAGGSSSDRWAPAASAAASYPLELPVAPAGPPNLRQYGGAPNAPDNGARTYKIDTPEELPVVIPTPEPSVLALLGFGFVLAGIRRMVRG